MGLTIKEKRDQWTIVLVLALLYTAFFLAALGVAVVFFDPSICGHAVAVVPCRLPALYVSWAACASLLAPALCHLRALLPPLTPAAAGLAFRRVGCPLYVLIGLLHYFAVTATEVGGRRYVVACTGAATVSFAGLLVFCACLVRECREVDDDELGSGYHIAGASEDIV